MVIHKVPGNSKIEQQAQVPEIDIDIDEEIPF